MTKGYLMGATVVLQLVVPVVSRLPVVYGQGVVSTLAQRTKWYYGRGGYPKCGQS